MKALVVINICVLSIVLLSQVDWGGGEEQQAIRDNLEATREMLFISLGVDIEDYRKIDGYINQKWAGGYNLYRRSYVQEKFKAHDQAHWNTFQSNLQKERKQLLLQLISNGKER